MKTMIKTVIALMTLALVLFALASCDFVFPQSECEHKFTEANCLTPKKCSICGVTEGEALGHKDEALAGKDATCTESGLTDGKKCSVCDEILVAQEVIPALGHTEEILAGEAPTCTSLGLTEGKKCSVCYEILVAQEEIPMAAHMEEVVPGKAPTCTEKGLTDGTKCSVCGAIVVAQEEILANGHKDENADFECDVCHVDLCTEHVPADAVEENRVEATCTAEGSYELVVKCSICGEELSRETKVVEKIAHVEKIIPAVAPTCTEAGLTEGKKCSVCGEILLAQEEIAAQGHTEVVLPGRELTCTVSGLTEGKKCSVCGEILVAQVETPAQGHIEEILLGKDATCEEAGLTEGKKCSVCEEILVAQVVIPKAHSFAEGECTKCGMMENIFAGNEFVPAESAKPSILVASWWKGSGYEGLTDGIKDADNAPGRFATVMKTSGMMDATMNLGGAYLLDTIKFYTYDPATGTSVGGLGTDLLIQVYSKGEWVDVIKCEDNAAIVSHLVVNEGIYNDYLEFDLGGIRGEKIRFYISASASASGTTYEEIECSAKVAPHEHSWVEATCAAPKTCSGCGATEGEALPHTEVIDAAVAQTCTSTGLTEGKHCSVCNAVLVAQEVIPMHNLVDGVCVDCNYAPNVFAGKEFIPTDSAKASVLVASWWKGSGYNGLTDGIKNADNAPGRFSTAMALTGMMDATINLGGTFELYSLRFYTYDPTDATNHGSLGANLLIQVSVNGEWIDVVNCADNAAIVNYLVVNAGAYNDYLEFDLGGIKAEKVRFFISASASASGTTYEEITCDAKKHVHVHTWKDATCTTPKTCSACEEIEGSPLGHSYVDSACSRCGYVRTLIENVFTGKVFVPTEGAAYNNQYNVNTHGYDKLTDGIYNKETVGRYSGKSTAGVIVEATLDLGAAYELSEFTIYMYKNGLNAFGTELQIQVLTPEGEWVTVVHCKSNAELTEHIVAKSGDEAGDKLVFDLGGVSATKIKFTMPEGTTSKYPSMHEIICSGYEK